jgi:uncharacterized Fe-S cluster protein YjdI
MSRRLQVYEHDALRVTFDPTLCIHAAACVRSLPRVFRPRERRWVQLEHGDPTAIVAAVQRCPTGALQVEGPGVPVTDEAVQLRTVPGGPLEVRGRYRLVRDDGTEVEGPARVAFCRCGRSANKPYCDGSHARLDSPPQGPTPP